MKHVIIGNGPAGIVAAETLRKADPEASITVIGAEVATPYSRMAIPYFIAGKIPPEGTHLRKRENHFAQLGIDLLHARVTRIDAAHKTLHLHDEQPLPYDRLLIASGASPVQLAIPGIDLPNVQSCWTIEDARNICDTVRPGTRVLLMGAGFVGCIVIAPLLKRGAHVGIVASGDRMVPRMMTEGAGKMIQKWIQNNGVTVYNDARVTAIEAGPDGVLTARMKNGESAEADLIINATGVKANIDFLKDSGIATEYGVLVDEYLRSNQPDIYAAGDVAQAHDIATGAKTTNAIQPNAVDQGRIAALNMAGKSTRFNGGIAMNVLDVDGLVSSSFGRWWGADEGEHVELMDESGWKYLRLEFKGDVMVGATAVGFTRHVGVLRGLIQAQVPLGNWKERLLKEPLRIMEAYLSSNLAATRHFNH
ncbi:MAG TPA: FAD-dependent oxidoreductase [Novimethylophilus sp.]|jgi:NAD(P)H-nitrite reductase large subunit|uniref:NAD(P)/FAD-dependent oxidoreductase n=1 Tax=Novimethylophilus sp. TaxID=2137426 RepID=UPI002F41F05A